MNYQDAKLYKEQLERRSKDLSSKLKSYPRNSMGLPPESVRQSAQYQNDKQAYNKAAKQIQEFNAWFTKTFSKEIREERRERGYRLESNPHKTAALDELVQQGDYVYYGVRFDSRSFKAGETLNFRSRTQYDGVPHDEQVELEGISTTEVKTTVKEAVDFAKKYYNVNQGYNWYLLGSDKEYGGEESREILLRDPVVLAVIQKRNPAIDTDTLAVGVLKAQPKIRAWVESEITTLARRKAVGKLTKTQLADSMYRITKKIYEGMRKGMDPEATGITQSVIQQQARENELNFERNFDRGVFADKVTKLGMVKEFAKQAVLGMIRKSNPEDGFHTDDVSSRLLKKAKSVGVVNSGNESQVLAVTQAITRLSGGKYKPQHLAEAIQYAVGGSNNPISNLELMATGYAYNTITGEKESLAYRGEGEGKDTAIAQRARDVLSMMRKSNPQFKSARDYKIEKLADRIETRSKEIGYPLRRDRAELVAEIYVQDMPLSIQTAGEVPFDNLDWRIKERYEDDSQMRGWQQEDRERRKRAGYVVRESNPNAAGLLKWAMNLDLTTASKDDLHKASTILFKARMKTPYNSALSKGYVQRYKEIESILGPMRKDRPNPAIEQHPQQAPIYTDMNKLRQDFPSWRIIGTFTDAKRAADASPTPSHVVGVKQEGEDGAVYLWGVAKGEYGSMKNPKERYNVYSGFGGQLINSTPFATFREAYDRAQREANRTGELMHVWNDTGGHFGKGTKLENVYPKQGTFRGSKSNPYEYSEAEEIADTSSSKAAALKNLYYQIAVMGEEYGGNLVDRVVDKARSYGASSSQIRKVVEVARRDYSKFRDGSLVWDPRLKRGRKSNPIVHAGLKSFVTKPDGKVVPVKNLGWILRNWQSIERMAWVSGTDNPMVEGVFQAYLSDGSVYTTGYPSKEVFEKFINRPVFKGLKINIDGQTKTIGEDKLFSSRSNPSLSALASALPDPMTDPSLDSFDAAIATSEVFHGRPVKETLDIDMEVFEHDNYAQLGTLTRLIYLAEPKSSRATTRDEITLDFPSPDDSASDVVRLCSDPERRTLYFIGGDQSLDIAALGFTKPRQIKDKIVLGTLIQIEYLSDKAFDKFQTINYYHKLGEDTKRFPVLLYDTHNGHLSLAGGEYTIEDRGIVN